MLIISAVSLSSCNKNSIATARVVDSTMLAPHCSLNDNENSDWYPLNWQPDIHSMKANLHPAEGLDDVRLVRPKYSEDTSLPLTVDSVLLKLKSKKELRGYVLPIRPCHSTTSEKAMFQEVREVDITSSFRSGRLGRHGCQTMT